MAEKIIFMGTPVFAAEILQDLIENDVNISLVVTQPDRMVGRKQVITPTPVKVVAIANDIPVFQPENIKDDYAPIVSLKSDLIITAAYGQIVPEAVLTAPRTECINVHGSLLPKYRGGAPIHYSVLNGDSETGVTIMKMAKKMDAGDIITQASFPIATSDTTADVHDKMIEVAKPLLHRTIEQIFSGDYQLKVQDESLVSFSPNITKEQERIDWNQQVDFVHNHIRGLSSWPGAYTTLNNRRLKIYRSKPTTIVSTAPSGSIVVSDNKMYVSCSDYLIELLIVQPDGKKQMAATDYIRTRLELNGSIVV